MEFWNQAIVTEIHLNYIYWTSNIVIFFDLTFYQIEVTKDCIGLLFFTFKQCQFIQIYDEKSPLREADLNLYSSSHISFKVQRQYRRYSSNI